MRKCKVLLYVCFISVSGLATSEQAIVMGTKSPEIVWLGSKKINQRNVRLIGLQTARKTQIERVIPKSEYEKIQSELAGWKNSLNRNLLPLDTPFCSEEMTFIEGEERSSICLDRIQRAERDGIFAWFRKQANLAAGRY